MATEAEQLPAAGAPAPASPEQRRGELIIRPMIRPADPEVLAQRQAQLEAAGTGIDQPPGPAPLDLEMAAAALHALHVGIWYAIEDGDVRELPPEATAKGAQWLLELSRRSPRIEAWARALALGDLQHGALAYAKAEVDLHNRALPRETAEGGKERVKLGGALGWIGRQLARARRMGPADGGDGEKPAGGALAAGQ